MSEKSHERQKAETQRTRTGYAIPVPKHRDVLDAFRKIVQPVKKQP